MRILELIEREPFGEIVEKTLKRFFEAYTKRRTDIKWYSRNPGIRRIRQEGMSPWFGSSQLNFLAPRSTQWSTLDVARRCYGRSPYWWRRFAQRAYVRGATWPPLLPLLSPVAMGVTGLVDEADWVFLGGNARLRLLRPDAGRAFMVAKEGFGDGGLDKEVEIRRRWPAIPAPELLGYDAKLGILEEKCVGGMGLNRLPQSHRPKFVEEACQKLTAHLIHGTVAEEAFEPRFTVLVERAAALCKGSRFIERDARLETLRHLGLIAEWARSEPRLRSATTLTAETHGDFQQGNVIVEGSRLWLIDWEYSRRRGILYDWFTMFAGARSAAGLGERVGRLLADDGGPAALLRRHWPLAPWDRFTRVALGLQFLVEDLILRFEMGENPIFRCASDGLQEYIVEWCMISNALGRKVDAV